MKHRYVRKTTGEQVTILAVDLIGPADNREWWITLSNGQQMTMYTFSEHFEVIGESVPPTKPDMPS